MPDLAASGYAAGAAVERARHKNWAQGVAGIARGVNTIMTKSADIVNAVITQEDGKISDYVERELAGDEVAGQKTEGWMDIAQKNSVVDPDNTLKIYEDAWNENVNVDRIMEGAGVSRAAAERWLRNQGTELHARVMDIAQDGQTRAYETKAYDDQIGYGKVLASRPEMTIDEFRSKYNERYEASGFDPSTAYGYSMSLDNPDVAMEFSSIYAEAKTKYDIEQNAKTGFMTKQDAMDMAEELFRQNMPDASDDPSLQYDIDVMAEAIRKDASGYYDEITTGVVNDSEQRMTQGAQEFARMVQENPEFSMTDEEFDTFVRETLGMDPDNNEIDRRNAAMLYETIAGGRSSAGNAKVVEWLSVPENRKSLDDFFASLEQSRLDGTPVSSRSYSFTAQGVTARDSEGNIMQNATLPYSEEQYVSSSAALNTIFRAYDAQVASEEGPEDIISTEYGEILDMMPEELRNDPEAFKAAVNYVNNYGAQRATLMSASMEEKAMNVATNISYTEQERRNLLAQMYAAGEIDLDSYTSGLSKIDFVYKEERELVLGMLKSYIDVQGDAMPEHLYDQMTSNIDFLDGLDKWIISWAQNGGNLQSAGAEQYIQNQVSIFGSGMILDEMNASYAGLVSEIIDGDMLIGNTYALSESNPAKLVQMRDQGELMWVRNDVCSAIRQQMSLADSSITTSADDLLGTASDLLFGSDYESLSDYQKSIVDVHATLAIYDQTNFELLHDTFVTGQNLGNYKEVTVRMGNGTRTGILGDDGFVYFMPNCSFDQNQAASYFYVGTNSDIYNSAMSGEDVRIDLAGYAIGTYKKPPETIAESHRTRNADIVRNYTEFIEPSAEGFIVSDEVVRADQGTKERFLSKVLADKNLQHSYEEIYRQIYPNGRYGSSQPNYSMSSSAVYKPSDDPMLIVGKKNIMTMQARKNNA